MSQAIEKPSPLVYQLLLYYLDRIPHEENLSFFGASFRLKVLLHEGLLSYPISGRSESIFSFHEEELMKHLTFMRDYSSLASLHLSDEIRQKVELFFVHALTCL